MTNCTAGDCEFSVALEADEKEEEEEEEEEEEKEEDMDDTDTTITCRVLCCKIHMAWF